MPAPDDQWANWDDFLDANGRVFMANRTTGETKWMWQKWSAQGRVFCLNVRTKARVWEDEMTPDLRIAAGFAPVQPVTPARPATTSFGLSKDVQAHGMNSSYHGFGVGPHKTLVGVTSSAGVVQRGEIGALRPSKRPRVASDANFGSFPRAEQQTGASRTANWQPGAVGGATNGSRARRGSSVGDTPSGARSGAPQRTNGLRNPTHESRVTNADRFVSEARSRPRPASPDISPEALPQVQAPRSSKSRLAVSMAQALGNALHDRRRRAGLVYQRDISPTLRPEAESDSTPCARAVSTSARAVVGTCRTVERMFLRLTSAPRPEDVRPISVLQCAFALVKRYWKDKSKDYEWVCSQLKSIRQDLQIQHIETDVTLQVYETHARIALENDDFGEFNTCVAQLSQLYARVPREQSVQDEFASYRILYNLLVDETGVEHSKLMQSMTPVQRERPCTKYALRVSRAVRDSDYHTFFELYASPPRETMVLFLLGHMAFNQRSKALRTMAYAYGPSTIPLSFVVEELSWNAQSCQGEAAAEETNASEHAILSFLREIGISLKETAAAGPLAYTIDAKASKRNGVMVLPRKRTLITAAGSQ